MKKHLLTMADETTRTTKDLLALIKILYPGYHPFWFILYMYLLYFRIIKRKLVYQLKVVPSKLIAKAIEKCHKFKDITNSVIVNEENIYKSDEVLLLCCDSTKICRPVFVVPNPKCQKDSLLLSEALYHNITKSGITSGVQLLNFQESYVNFADEVDISWIMSPHDIASGVSDSLLQRFFQTPKLISKNDIIEIDVRFVAPDAFFVNTIFNVVEKVYFKCNKMMFKGKEIGDCCFCVIGETAVKQSANVQSFLPQRLLKEVYFDGNENGVVLQEVSFCPYGLQNYFDKMKRAVKPFMLKRKLKLRPLFLLQGNKGCGKDVLVTSLAHHLGMHLYKINNTDLVANVYAQNETKMRNALFNGKMAAPCVISIYNFENFGKNVEGQFDERLIGYFAEELDNLFENNPFPVFLFCCSNEKNIPSALKTLFLETFEVNAPTDKQRENLLSWILEDRGMKYDFDLGSVANKTHGFFFEDLKALVFYARKHFENTTLQKDVVVLTVEDFSNALDTMQSNYNETLGAPKVPKVQWSDIGGLEDVKHEIIKTINLPLKHPEFLKNSGLKRSGILLFGPPGTGKTLIAKAVATECSLCFLSVKGPELLNMYVGQSEQNIREVFERARAASPCIIFFDELDSLAPNRGLSGDSGGVMDRVVSQLLAEMDGLTDSATVFIIGATNRPDLIDPALLRPGRFDKLLYVGPCTDPVSKTAVLEALTRKFNVDEGLELSEVVGICPNNITGADFYGICSTAWSSAVRRLIQNVENGDPAGDKVSHQDVTVAFEDFRVAVENVKPSISAEDMKYFEKLKLELSSNA